MLCNHASKQIQMKSHNVEDAVLEVIDLLCGNIKLVPMQIDDLQIQYSNVGLELEDDESDGLNLMNFFLLIHFYVYDI